MHRYILGAGSIGVAGLSVISLILNLQFGLEVGGWTFAAASVCLDLVKMALPVAFVIACTARGHSLIMRVIGGGAFAGAWLLVSALSLQSAGGAALLNRINSTGTRADIIEKRQMLAAERKRLLNREPWTPQIERYRAQPSDAIRAQIEAHKNAWQWRASRQCDQATTGSTRRYCQNYRMMEAALQVAAGREKDARRIREIEAKLDKLPALVESDPYSAAIADVTRIDRKWVVYFWAGLIALLLEVISNVGPALLMLAYRLSEEHKPSSLASVSRTDGQALRGQGKCLATAVATQPERLAALGQDSSTGSGDNKQNQNDAVVLDLGHFRLAKMAKQPECLASGQGVPGQQFIRDVLRKAGPGQRTLDEIMELISAAAKAAGQKVPRKSRIGALLTEWGHEHCGRRREGNKRVTVYNLNPENSTTESAG